MHQDWFLVICWQKAVRPKPGINPTFARTMKQITSLLLAFSMLMQASVPALWVLDYQLRRAIYLKQCENKNKPNLHCDGKCYLKKQVTSSAGTNPKEPRLPENFYSIKNLNFICEPVETFVVEAVSATGLLHTLPPYTRFCPDAPATRLFKPPAAG